MVRLIRTHSDLLAALRARKEQIDVSFETLDSIAGWQSGYGAKLLAPTAIRKLGQMSLPTILGALGVALTMVEDTAATEKVRGLWVARKRPQRLAD